MDGPENFLKYMNPASLEVRTGFVEASLAAANPGERFQFERMGYFVADEKDHSASHPVFNRTVTLEDSYKPEN